MEFDLNSLSLKFLLPLSVTFPVYRLANLLRDDEQRYVAEFEAMKDTPEKQMEKTRRRCSELKAKREKEDQEKSAAIMDRKFQFAFTFPVLHSSLQPDPFFLF